MISLKPLVLSLVIAATLAGCGASSPDQTTSLPSGTLEAPLSGVVKMEISGFAYQPSTIFVKKGSTLEVTNLDTPSHTVSSADETVESGFIGLNGTESIKLDKVGTFKVSCKPHPSITGTITVVE